MSRLFEQNSGSSPFNFLESFCFHSERFKYTKEASMLHSGTKVRQRVLKFPIIENVQLFKRN